MLELGKTAPPFNLPDQNGEVKTFSDLTGSQGLVLYVYPKDNTPGCSTEAKEFRDLLKDFHRLGFSVAGVSRDSIQSHSNFANKYDLNFSILSDKNRSLIESLGAWGQKKIGGRISEGVIRGTVVLDPDQKVIRSYEHVKAKGHAYDVLQDLRKSLDTGKTNYWLLKSEPEVYGWEDLVREGRTYWNGVRNAQARNYIRDMHPGDKILFYHSGKERSVVGTAEVTSLPYQDPSTDDRRWLAIDIVPRFSLAQPVTIKTIKNHPALVDIPLIRQSRLSVVPVSPEEFEIILNLGGRAE